MAILYCFAARCLFGVVFLHKAKQGRWQFAVSAYKCLPHQRTAHRFTRHESAKSLRPGQSLIDSYLFPSSWALRCVLWEIFLKVFGSGQSDVRSGTSMPPCCVVNAMILYTLIHWIIPNTAHAQTVDYRRAGRAMFCHAILITQIPWLVHVPVHYASRSHRSWAHLRLPRIRKPFKTSRQWR